MLSIATWNRSHRSMPISNCYSRDDYDKTWVWHYEMVKRRHPRSKSVSFVPNDGAKQWKLRNKESTGLNGNATRNKITITEKIKNTFTQPYAPHKQWTINCILIRFNETINIIKRNSTFSLLHFATWLLTPISYRRRPIIGDDVYVVKCKRNKTV